MCLLCASVGGVCWCVLACLCWSVCGMVVSGVLVYSLYP